MSTTLLESLDNITRIIETKCTDAGGEIQFKPEKLGPFHEEAGYVAGRLGINEFQAILLAVIIQASTKVGMDLGMSYLRRLFIIKECLPSQNGQGTWKGCFLRMPRLKKDKDS